MLSKVKRMPLKLLARLRQTLVTQLPPWPSRRRNLRRVKRKTRRAPRSSKRRRTKRPRRPMPTRRPLWSARMPRRIKKKTEMQQRS